MDERYFITVRFIHKGEPRQLIFFVRAGDAAEARRIAQTRLPKGAKWLGTTATKAPPKSRDPHSRLLYQGSWPNNARSEKRFYKAVWFPEEKVAILYERSISKWKTRMVGKRVEFIPTPEAGEKWKTWGTYPLSEFRGDMKELLRVLRSDIRYESLTEGKRRAIDDAKERERGVRVALMGRKKALNKFGSLLRRAERLAIKAEKLKSHEMLEKADRSWDAAGRIIDGFGETDRETRHLAKDWTTVGRILARARKRIPNVTERDPSGFRKSAKGFPNRVPNRKPDRCFVYKSKKGYNVTCAWSSRRASRNFRTEKLAMAFARKLRCKVVKGSEFSRLPKATKQAIYKKVPVIMKEDGYPRGQAFAAALSMALRGTLKAKKTRSKKKTPKQKNRAKMKAQKRSR